MNSGNKTAQPRKGDSMVPTTPQATAISVKKRNGQQVPFYEERILNAIESAFKAHLGVPQESDLDDAAEKNVFQVCHKVVAWCEAEAEKHGVVFIEDIQNAVVRELRENGFEAIGRRYDEYRRLQELKRFENERVTIQKRDGRSVSFKPEKITIAIAKAFLAYRGTEKLEGADRQAALRLADIVVSELKSQNPGVVTLHIERIQDLVEEILMRENFHEVARRYIIYREERRMARLQEPRPEPPVIEKERIQLRLADGGTEFLDLEKLKLLVAEICHGLEDRVSVDTVVQGALRNCFEGMRQELLEDAIGLAIRVEVEKEPTYSFVAARLLLRKLYKEVLGREITLQGMKGAYSEAFAKSIHRAVEVERLSPALLDFNLEKLGAALKQERDLQFGFMGLQTLYDRYFLHHEGVRLETPQIFWMRVAMGLAQKEGERKNEMAIRFYDVLSTFRFVSSTPTLFNCGSLHPQLSSCFLTTIGDDLDNIFKCIKDNAMLSKWSGGLGNDWTPVRALGARIKGTNGKSQGVIPFMKVANDTAVAVNQGGKRQGAVCAYMEVWHMDIEEFLDLRKNTGDDRRRTHDMHTANWIPDLFMKRVRENAQWTLFSPNEVPELHDLYGRAFEEKYVEYEKKAQEGKMRQYKVIGAIDLWRKTLSMLFETGHPWITFKDPSNLRSPQDHKGVVHSSNLCTEILLNTSYDETAVCNLGSVNLAAHTTSAGLDQDLLADTVHTAIRMLDNVIDINYYPTVEARNSNLRHRPIGMGLMGFQDALYIQSISYASPEAADFADESMELISYHAILASSELAAERGTYESYKGSKWDRGLLPIDTIAILEEERGGHLTMDRSMRLDWTPVRESVRKNGMRNCNTMAIAPTATIANISGITQSIEPTYKHVFVKSNLSGEFTVVNPFLVEELRALGLWDQQMIDDLKYFDGSLREITRIPQSLRDRYLTAFEISPEWIIECASRRQKWIDMGQSLNLYLEEPSGKKMHNMYMLAWEKGLKTTYYLRSLGATRIEKSTLDVNKYGDPLGKKTKAPRTPQEEMVAKQCSIDNGEDCEACQ